MYYIDSLWIICWVVCFSDQSIWPKYQLIGFNLDMATNYMYRPIMNINVTCATLLNLLRLEQETRIHSRTKFLKWGQQHPSEPFRKSRRAAKNVKILILCQKVFLVYMLRARELIMIDKYFLGSIQCIQGLRIFPSRMVLVLLLWSIHRATSHIEEM